MDCTGARAALWPPDRPRLVSGVIESARRHVQGCDACSEYFEQEPSLLDLYDRARTRGAPHEVRARIVHALADEPLPHPLKGTRGGDSRPLARRLVPGIVVAGLAAISIAVAAETGRSVEGPNMFVEDYLRRAVGDDHIETQDPAEVTRFLQRELGVRFEPILLAGLEISRAEICLLKDQRGAMIVYHEQGARVTHYLVPTSDATVRSPAISGNRGARASMPVVTWATPNVEQALVGEVDAHRLLEIAAISSSRR